MFSVTWALKSRSPHRSARSSPSAARCERATPSRVPTPRLRKSPSRRAGELFDVPDRERLDPLGRLTPGAPGVFGVGRVLDDQALVEGGQEDRVHPAGVSRDRRGSRGLRGGAWKTVAAWCLARVPGTRSTISSSLASDSWRIPLVSDCVSPCPGLGLVARDRAGALLTTRTGFGAGFLRLVMSRPPRRAQRRWCRRRSRGRRCAGRWPAGGRPRLD